MFQADSNFKVVKIVYQIAFPVAVIIVLLGIASSNSRPRLLDSGASDLIIRLMLCIWFCTLYIRLSRISSFSFFPDRKWSKSDVGELEKYFYIGISFLFSLGCGVITRWIIHWFLPDLAGFAFVIAFINCFVIFLPLAVHYWVLKL